MEKIELKVTGMSCGHCENAVKKALESIPGVKSATADRNDQSAIIEAEGVNRSVLIEAVKKAGYEAS